MKIRNGFVSNSSSSSFIIGLAAVTQEQLDTMPQDDKYFEVYPINGELWTHAGWSFRFTGDNTMTEDGTYKNPPSRAEIEAFDWTNVSVDLTGKTHLVELRAYDDVPYNDDYDEYDYDSVDLDWFDEDAQAAYNWIHDVGGEATYGAGYNG